MNTMSKLGSAGIVTLVLVFAVSTAPAPAGAARVREDEKAKKEVGDITKALGKRMHFSESANFTWASSVPPGRARSIQRAAERAFGIFAEDSGVSTWREMFDGQKAMGVICPNARGFKKYTAWYAKTYPVWNKEEYVKLHSGSSWYATSTPRVCFASHYKPHDQKFLEAINAHVVGHLCAERYAFHNNFTPAWFMESLAIYLEMKVTGKMQCGCYQDQYGLAAGDEDRQMGLAKSKVHARIKKAMRKRQLKNMKGLIKLQALSELEYNDVLMGYAVVAWMTSQKGKTAKFIREMKKAWPPEISIAYAPGKGVATEKAFKATFDLTLQGVDAAVDAYVKKNL